MAQQVKVTVAQSGDLRPVPRTHIKRQIWWANICNPSTTVVSWEQETGAKARLCLIA